MKKKTFLFISLILMFVPMPFVWFGYGEKGYYGYSMLGNVFFLGGLGMLLLSCFLKNKVWKLFRNVGGAFIMCSYGWAAQDFCRHLPVEITPLEVCRFPMWISFIGAVGMTIYICFLTEENKKAELE